LNTVIVGVMTSAPRCADSHGKIACAIAQVTDDVNLSSSDLVTVGLKRKIAKVEKASDMQETSLTSNTSRVAVLEHQVRVNKLAP
jgi:hypothetical protein